ncbi:MAG: heme ABC exporter ATP-binding protein CcmA [Porphyrobacter sp.]|nr:heme ABC exporter ATP-binding protein CcmA [Porphyrobacter sp.]
MEAARPLDARLAATDLACRRGERLLFRGLSFELKAGEALQIVGPNGTGKSSLLRILAGLMQPLAGTVDRNVSVALLDERLPLDGHLPLNRAVAFWSRLQSGHSDPNLIESNGLGRLADVPVRFLSTGQRKRAAILVSNTHNAGLWLLDEPLNGLDVNAAADFQRLLADYLAKGGMAIIASHQPFDVPGLRQISLQDFAA